MTRVLNIAEILHDSGYTVTVNPIPANDVDMTIFRDGRQVAVAEILNFKYTSFIDRKRKGSIIRNLSKYRCEKFVICSFLSNLRNYVNEIKDAGVNVIEIGFQTIPLKYYAWFKQYDIPCYDRRPLTPATRKIVKNRLSKYFAYVYDILLVLEALFDERRLNLGDNFSKMPFRELWEY